MVTNSHKVIGTVHTHTHTHEHTSNDTVKIQGIIVPKLHRIIIKELSLVMIFLRLKGGEKCIKLSFHLYWELV